MTAIFPGRIYSSDYAEQQSFSRTFIYPGIFFFLMDNKLVNQIARVPDNTSANCLPHKAVTIHISHSVYCSIDIHSSTWSWELFFMKEKADFNDHLILFNLDVSYSERLDLSSAV